ncbi:MAG: hypothetical protein M0Z82_05285 [Actinomycetota bacterium]|nr:hypothetical protein [Actinomycetota bacterium]
MTLPSAEDAQSPAASGAACGGVGPAPDVWAGGAPAVHGAVGGAPAVDVTKAPGSEMPEPAVLAAVVAAVDQLWPSVLPAGPDPEDRSGDYSTWRFSGRWWAKPTVLRRDRPSVRG